MTLMLLGTVLVATVLAGLWRIVVGPSHADRMLAVQLFGTAGAAVLVVWAQVAETPALRDAALVLALLAAIVSAALVQFLRQPTRNNPRPENPTRTAQPPPSTDAGTEQ